VPTITFKVTAPGYVTKDFKTTPEVAAALHRGASVSEHRIVLRREAVVEGTVIGPDGLPVAGMVVGVVGDPLTWEPDRRTSVRADKLGRFRLVGLDPRWKVWLFAKSRGAIHRPLALNSLSADAVTFQTIVVENRRNVDVTIDVGVADADWSVFVDYHRAHPMERGVFRTTLLSGPHHLEFRTADNETIHEFQRWIEPDQPECYLRVAVNAKNATDGGATK